MFTTVRAGRYIIVVCLLIVVGGLGVFLWQKSAPMSPDKALYAALDENLRQPGMSCQISQSDTTSSTVVSLDIDLKSTSGILARTVLRQQSSSVTTEELDTKGSAFIRYTQLETTQKAPNGQKWAASKALNVWAQTHLSSPTLYARTVLGNCVVPLAHLSVTDEKQMSDELRKGKIFTYDTSKVRRETLRGTPVYVYDVTVQPKPYVDLMKQVAKATGMADVKAVNSSEYASRTPQKMQFYVSRQNPHVQQIVYATKKRKITFSDYGQIPRFKVPTQSISTQELQKRLTGQ